MALRTKPFPLVACSFAIGSLVAVGGGVVLWRAIQPRSVSVTSPPSATPAASSTPPAAKLAQLSVNSRSAWSWALSQLTPEASKTPPPACIPMYVELYPKTGCRGPSIFPDARKVCGVERVWGAARAVVQLSEGAAGRVAIVELPESLSCDDIGGTSTGDGDCALRNTVVQFGPTEAEPTVVQLTTSDGIRACGERLVVCPTVAKASVSVVVTDSATGQQLCDADVAMVRDDGKRFEFELPFEGRAPELPCRFHTLWQGEGSFTVSARRKGYLSETRKVLLKRADRCFIAPHTLQVALRPKSAAATKPR